MKDMPSAAQTGGSTEQDVGVLKHEKEELMDTSSPQQDISDASNVTASSKKGHFACKYKCCSSNIAWYSSQAWALGSINKEVNDEMEV